jgi:transcriptional regulator with XRE-family HTH domain
LTAWPDRREALPIADPEEVDLDDDEVVGDVPLDPRPTSSRGQVPVQLGANIAELRRDAHLGKAELAERAAMHRSAVEQNEAGRCAPNVVSALKLAGSLGVSIDRLTLGICWNPPAEIAAAGGRRGKERLHGFFSTRPAHLSGDSESPVQVIEDPARVPVIIGANLRDARRRRRLPQGGLGLEQTHVSRIELGLVEPALGTLIGLARELEILVEALLAGMIWGGLGPPEAWQGPAAAGRIRRRDARSLDAAVARGRREGRGNVEIARSLGVESEVVRRVVTRLRSEGRDVEGRPDTCTGADVEDELALRLRENGEDLVEEEMVPLLIGENIKMNRRRLGLGQETLARAVGAGDSTYLSRIEKHGVKMSLTYLIRFAAALRLPCSTLTDGVRWDHAAGTFLIPRHTRESRPTDAELIGQNARRIRRVAGLSEATVARRVDRRGRFFNALELGGKLPKPVSLLMLARALEAEVGDLLAGVCDWYVRPLPPPEIPTGEEGAAKAAQQERLLRLWDRGDDLRSIGEAVDLKPQTVFGVVDRLRDVGVYVPYRKAPTAPAQLSARLRRRRANRPPAVRAEAESRC